MIIISNSYVLYLILFLVGFGCGMYHNVFVCSNFFLRPCMAINVSVYSITVGFSPTLYC